MAKTNALVNGKTITVDNTQIDIKFTRSLDQLNNSLSRAQTSLGLYYDNNRKLVDVLGRCVEGLSLSQIRLGMWVDEAGRARTISEGYADGLSRVQLELGHFANAEGEVFNALGQNIGRTKEAIQIAEAKKKAENEAFEAQQRARAALGESAGAVATSANQFAVLSREGSGVSAQKVLEPGVVAPFRSSEAAYRKICGSVRSVDARFDRGNVVF